MYNKSKSSNRKNSKFNDKKRINGKPSKYNSKQYSGKYNPDAEDAMDKATNDPNWYANDPSLLRDAASIPFSWATGTATNMGNQYVSLNDPKAMVTFPNGGVCGIELTPVVCASEYVSPVNIASNNFYTFIRHVNSGHVNYDAPDLMLYILAMANVYSYINWMCRVYGIATLYSQRNRFLPHGLYAVEGIDYDNLAGNLADFRYGINLLINQAASLSVPSNMTLFLRQAFLYQNVYTEGVSIKDQLYMYYPGNFYIYGLDEESAGCLTPIDGGLTSFKTKGYTGLLELGKKILNAVIASEDCQIMSGDILKAYGDSGVFKLNTLAPDYALTPIFDIAVLEQMANAVLVPYDIHGLQITQNSTKSHLVCTPTLSISNKTNDPQPVLAGRSFCQNKLLSTTTADPGPEIVMESTRLIPAVTAANYDQEAEILTLDLEFGSEAVTNIVYSYSYEDDAIRTFKATACRRFGNNTVSDVEVNGNPVSFKTIIWRDTVIKQFKFHPGTLAFRFSAQVQNQPDETMFIRSLDNYAVLSNEDIARLHETAMMSMLNTPAINRLG